MYKNFANAVGAWLSKENVVDVSERELYAYAFYSLLFGLTPIFISIILGVIFKMLVESLILIIPFMIIRKFSGGFHLKKPCPCLICSTLLLSFSLCLIKYIICLNQTSVISSNVLIAALIIFLLSPIDSEARRLSQKEKVLFRRISKLLTTLFVGIYFITLVYFPINISTSFGIGIILVAFLQLPCLIKKIVHFKSKLLLNK